MTNETSILLKIFLFFTIRYFATFLGVVYEMLTIHTRKTKLITIFYHYSRKNRVCGKAAEVKTELKSCSQTGQCPSNHELVSNRKEL